MHVPIEIYQLLEYRLGRKEAQKVVEEAIEASLSYIETRSREIASQCKLEIKTNSGGSIKTLPNS